jgi:hypothetical protein
LPRRCGGDRSLEAAVHRTSPRSPSRVPPFLPSISTSFLPQKPLPNSVAR